MRWHEEEVGQKQLIGEVEKRKSVIIYEFSTREESALSAKRGSHKGEESGKSWERDWLGWFCRESDSTQKLFHLVMRFGHWLKSDVQSWYNDNMCYIWLL